MLRATTRKVLDRAGRGSAGEGKSAAAQRTHTRLLCWGTLGGQTKPARPTELLLEGLPPRDDGSIWDFTAVATGLNHIALLTSAGEIVLAGNNKFGQVGQPSAGADVAETVPYAYDVGYEEKERPDTIRCGCNFNILFKRGTRFATVIGNNLYGQLGLGSKTILNNSDGFAEWSGDAPWWQDGEVIDDIACGKNHTFIITSHGRVLGCGSNQWGELGFGDNTSPMQPTPMAHFLPHDTPEPADVRHAGARRIRQIAAGNAFSVMLTKSGHVYGCGSSEYGQLIHRDLSPMLQPIARHGGSDTLLRIKRVGCLSDMACFLTKKDELFVRGCIPDVGVTTNIHRTQQITVHESLSRPVKHLICGSTNGLLVGADGSVAGFGNNTEGQLKVAGGRINTAPTAYVKETVGVLAAPTVPGTVDWKRQLAVGHGWTILIDRAEAYDVGPKALEDPVTLPPRVADGKRRRLKFW